MEFAGYVIGDHTDPASVLHGGMSEDERARVLAALALGPPSVTTESPLPLPAPTGPGEMLPIGEGEPQIAIAFRASYSIRRNDGRMAQYNGGERVGRPDWDEFERMLGDRTVAVQEWPLTYRAHVRCVSHQETAKVCLLSEGMQSPGTMPEPHIVPRGQVMQCELSDARWLVKNHGFAWVTAHEMLEEKPDARILVMRNRGLGDVMMALCAVASLVRRHPQAQIVFATFPHYFRLLEGFPHVREVIALDERQHHGPFDGIADLILYPEMNADTEWQEHRIEIFARALGLEKADNYDLWFQVNDEDRAWARAQVGEETERNVSVHVGTNSGGERDWPTAYVGPLCERLLESGLRPVLLGEHYRGTLTVPDGTLNLIGKTSDIGHLAAVMDACLCLIVTDSGLLHIGRALRKPLVALMGPYHSRLRLSDSDEATCFDGDLKSYAPDAVARAAQMLIAKVAA